MSNVILWSLAIVGGLGVIVVGGFFILEAWADKAQREGRNPFE